jgi:uncharacterized protein YjdB
MKEVEKAVAVVVVLSAVLGFGCAPTPVTIEISPPDVTINSADQAPTMTARVLDLENNPIEDVKVVWSSADEGVVTIDPASGKLQVKGSGRAEIKAETGATYGIAMVTVALYKELVADTKSLQLRIGEVQQVSATIADETGEPIQGEVVWESADPKIASVVGSRGEVRGVAPGTTTVTATAKALKVDVKIEVMKPGPADLQVSKALIELKAGKTAKVEGLPVDDKGQPAAGFPVAYSSDDTEIATVAEDGTVTAVAKGDTFVTVTAGDKSVQIKVSVK